MDTSKRWHKTYASILEWQWFKDPYKVQLWEALRALASISKVQGEVETSIRQLMQVTGQSKNTVLKHIRDFNKSGEIIYKPGIRQSTIIIANWSRYQSGKMNEPQVVQSMNRGVTDEPQVVQSMNRSGSTNEPHYIDIDNIKQVNITSSSSSSCVCVREGKKKMLEQLAEDAAYWKRFRKMFGGGREDYQALIDEFDNEQWLAGTKYADYRGYGKHLMNWIRKKKEIEIEAQARQRPARTVTRGINQPRPSLDSSGNPIDRIAVAKANAQQNAAERRYKASREEMNELMVHYPTLDLKDRESVANALEEIRRRKKK